MPEFTDAPRRWRFWSAEWGWRERAALWDRDVDRQVRDRLIADQLEARRRHARLAKATLTVLSLPVKAALEVANDPGLNEKLKNIQGPGGAQQLVSQVVRVESAIPSVVSMERMALGMTTDSVEVGEKRDFDIAFDNRILADPEAVELAQRLLQIGAGRSETLALRSGDVGESGTLAPDAPSGIAEEETG